MKLLLAKKIEIVLNKCFYENEFCGGVQPHEKDLPYN
jgi:hypothetical protein